MDLQAMAQLLGYVSPGARDCICTFDRHTGLPGYIMDTCVEKSRWAGQCSL